MKKAIILPPLFYFFNIPKKVGNKKPFPFNAGKGFLKPFTLQAYWPISTLTMSASSTTNRLYR